MSYAACRSMPACRPPSATAFSVRQRLVSVSWLPKRASTTQTHHYARKPHHCTVTHISSADLRCLFVQSNQSSIPNLKLEHEELAQSSVSGAVDLFTRNVVEGQSEVLQGCKPVKSVSFTRRTANGERLNRTVYAKQTKTRP